jgi:hypothetical protein
MCVCVWGGGGSVALSASVVCDKYIQTADCAVSYSKPRYKQSSASINMKSRHYRKRVDVDRTADVVNVERRLSHILQCSSSRARHLCETFQLYCDNII